MAKKYNMNGVRKSPPDIRLYKGIAKVTSQELPDEFELAKCKAKDQGVVGSCVAHSLASCVEYFNKRESKTYEKMSTGFIYGNRRNTIYKGEGMSVSKALDALRHYGTTKAADWDINVEVPQAIDEFEKVYEEYAPLAYQNRITKYFKLRDVNSIKATLYQGNPVVISITCREDTRIKDGVWIINEKSKSCGGHCMYIYGWCKKGWKVANSWSSGWGDNGNIIIPYETKLDDIYGVQDTFDSTKVNNNIKYYENLLAKTREEYLQIFIEYGDVLDKENQKKADELKKKMEEIELKIKALKAELIEVEKPFDKLKLIAKILNAIIQFVWKLFNKG